MHIFLILDFYPQPKRRWLNKGKKYLKFLRNILKVMKYFSRNLYIIEIQKQKIAPETVFK